MIDAAFRYLKEALDLERQAEWEACVAAFDHALVHLSEAERMQEHIGDEEESKRLRAQIGAYRERRTTVHTRLVQQRASEGDTQLSQGIEGTLGGGIQPPTQCRRTVSDSTHARPRAVADAHTDPSTPVQRDKLAQSPSSPSSPSSSPSSKSAMGFGSLSNAFVDDAIKCDANGDSPRALQLYMSGAEQIIEHLRSQSTHSPEHTQAVTALLNRIALLANRLNDAHSQPPSATHTLSTSASSPLSPTVAPGPPGRASSFETSWRWLSPSVDEATASRRSARGVLTMRTESINSDMVEFSDALIGAGEAVVGALKGGREMCGCTRVAGLVCLRFPEYACGYFVCVAMLMTLPRSAARVATFVPRHTTHSRGPR